MYFVCVCMGNTITNIQQDESAAVYSMILYRLTNITTMIVHNYSVENDQADLSKKVNPFHLMG